MIGKSKMNHPTVSEFTNHFYISNIPQDTTIETLVGYMIWAGPVSGVKFPINKETGRKKGYAVVTMHRKVPALASLELLKRKIGAGNPLQIATDLIANRALC
jgi:RNA recognition motif-containing protein